VAASVFRTNAKGFPVQAEKSTVTLLRKPQVLARTGIPKSSWDRGVRQGRYPKPVKIGVRAIAWTSTSIDALICDLVEKSLEAE
jgi:prophage regulatory protein